MDFTYLPEEDNAQGLPETYQVRPQEAVRDEVHHIFVDNRDRAANSGGPFDFHIDLQDIGMAALRHVTSIKVRCWSIPKCADEDYVTVYMGRGGMDISSTDQASSYPTLVLFYDSQLLPTGTAKPMRDRPTVRFDPPSSMSRLSIKICKHGGATLAPEDTNDNAKCAFLLSVTTREQRW